MKIRKLLICLLAAILSLAIFSACEERRPDPDAALPDPGQQQEPEKQPEKEPEKEPEKDPEEQPVVPQDPEKEPQKDPEKQPETPQEPEKDPEKEPEKQPEEPKHTHAGEWTVTVEPTCTRGGERQRRCSLCGELETESLSALGHDFEKAGDGAVEASCEKGGGEDLFCKRCKKLIETSYALGHDYTGVFAEELAPTCTESGRESKFCAREGCGKLLLTRLIAPLGHDFEELSSEESSCGGIVKTFRCKREGCGFIRKETSGGDHDFGEWVQESPASCIRGAWRSQVCKKCGVKDTRYFAETGHFWSASYTLGEEPTAEHDGYKYLACTVCGAEKTDSRVVIPRYTIGEEMDFTVTVLRQNGLPYQGSALIRVLKEGTEVASAETRAAKATFRLPAKDYTLALSDLSRGYFPAEESFVLRPGLCETTVYVSASYVGGEKPADYRYQTGDALYDLDFTSYDGKTYEVSALLKEYKAIFLDFYYTTCGYCNQEFPSLIAAQEKYGEEVLIVYVNGHGEDGETVAAHAKKTGIKGIIAQKFLIDDFPESRGGWGYPTMVILDCEGTIAERNRGVVYGDYFEKKMKEYIRYAAERGWKKGVGIPSGNAASPTLLADLPPRKKGRLF